MKKLIYLAKHYLQMAKDKGLGAVFNRLKNRFATKHYEKKFNISTEQPFTKQSLGYPEESGYAEYGPIDYLSFINVLKQHPQWYQDGSFLDYGCGLGRALFIAAMFPFKKIIGIDLSPRLCELAKQNIAQSKNIKNPERLEIICGDATLYEVPKDVRAIFINNSFTGEVLEHVFNQAVNSCKAYPRDLTLICNLPIDSQFEKQLRARKEFAIENYFIDESNQARCYVLAKIKQIA